MATSEGLFRYAPYVWRSPLPLEDLNSHVLALLEDAPNRLWVASADFLLRFTNGLWRTIPWPSGGEVNFEAPTALYSLPNDQLVISATDRTTLFDPKKEQFSGLPHPANRRIKVVGQLSDRSLLVQIMPIEPAPPDAFELERFDGAAFRPFLKSTPQWTFGNEVSFALAMPNHDLWIGGTGGLARFRNGAWETYGPAESFRSGKPLTMAEMGGGRLWCATRDRIYEFNGRNWSLVRGGFDRISRIVRGRDDKVWVATAQGLFCFSSITSSWVAQGIEEGLPSPGVSDVLVDQEGRVWAGTTRGLSLYHPETDHSLPRTLPPILDNPGSREDGEKVVVLLNGGTAGRKRPPIAFSMPRAWTTDLGAPTPTALSKSSNASGPASTAWKCARWTVTGTKTTIRRRSISRSCSLGIKTRVFSSSSPWGQSSSSSSRG